MCVVGCDKKNVENVVKFENVYRNENIHWVSCELQWREKGLVVVILWSINVKCIDHKDNFTNIDVPLIELVHFFFIASIHFRDVFFSPSIQLSKLLQNIDSKLQKISAPDIQWNTRINCVCKVIEIDEIVSCKQDKKPHQMKQK